MLELFHRSEFIFNFEVREVFSLKTCLEGGNLVKQILHAPWCIKGFPSDNFYRGHMQRTSMGGGEASIVLKEIHGRMWSKGAWTWLKAKASSGRTNNASKGVDERVWAVQLVDHAGTKVTKGRSSRWRKTEPGRHEASQAGRPGPAGLPYKMHPPMLAFSRQATLPSLCLSAQVFSPEPL
jgi:hypothetical protein